MTDLGTLCSYLLLIGIFALAGGIVEGVHVWRLARAKRPDWLDEGNRRIW